MNRSILKAAVATLVLTAPLQNVQIEFAGTVDVKVPFAKVLLVGPIADGVLVRLRFIT